MTRYARANNCQKRKPEEASSWKELAAGGSGEAVKKTSSKRKFEESEGWKSEKKKWSTNTRYPKGNNSRRKEVIDSNGWQEHLAKLNQKTASGDAETSGDGNDASFVKREKLDVSRNRELRFGGDFGRTFEDEPKKGNPKVCFNCRKPGHRLADCPTAQARDKGKLCFKCGSTEHDIKKCQVTTDDMPFATCFVCGKLGHLSRSCPDNEKGIYAMGGECRGCGSKDHLYTQCPKNKTKKGPESLLFYVDKVSSFERNVDKLVMGPKRQEIAKPKHKVVKF